MIGEIFLCSPELRVLAVIILDVTGKPKALHAQYAVDYGSHALRYTVL